MHHDRSSPPRLSRRHWLQCTAMATLAGATTLQAQETATARTAEAGRALTIAQMADMSATQQDVSRDFLMGSRAAWQDLNARGGLLGRPVKHLVLETDGSAASLQAAWQKAHATPDCVALSGCVGHAAAAGLATLQAHAATSSPLAQIAPWLHSSAAHTADNTVFDIFAGDQAQITHALKTLATLGAHDIGVVYGSARLQQASQADIAQVAQTMGLRTQALSAASRSAPPHPLILFIGGTPELHVFMRQLVLPAGRQCYVVALADVNLQVLAQLGGLPRNTSVIATQAVPLLTSSLPVVRAYRTALARLYDEPASPLGLAGFIAARYTGIALASINGAITRASVLTALRRRSDANIGGFMLTFQNKKRISSHVTQTMLTPDGRIIG
ncbi:ABC transporter substrate-binding protein [Simplicispira psychrophila]|uniref:ABC transporter substrate-binding protein n=1 Tax=Simplicispira psychrophila TaxID=80882 RepID=UPI0004846205|nr:ABC transporter substrate-binding protein [Simplicispira psychrophila]